MASTKIIKLHGNHIMHLSIIKTDFNCPKCTKLHEEKDFDKRLNNSSKGYIYMKCKGCKTVLGVSTDIMGDVVAWVKDEEPS